jgi:hypothetical protein
VADLEVVFGPRTRLAAALLSRHPVPRGMERILVARDERDASWIAGAHPGAPILRGDRDETIEPADRLRIYGCAVGPVHPGEAPVIADDVERARRDFELVRRLADRAPGAVTELVFISSVLALAPHPRKEREYYSVWKRIVEVELERIAARASGSNLSVYYPGRLVHTDTASFPMRLIHTTFDALADLITAPGAGEGSRRVVGTDARLWLLRRGVVARPGIRPPTGGRLADELATALGRS